MKRIDECGSMAVLTALLVVGILLVMGAYRIFSYLCENAALDARTFLLGAACLLLAVVLWKLNKPRNGGDYEELKRWNSVQGVNITLGLPIIRVSVDHGTAFGKAGNGTASADSLVNAIGYGARMAVARKKALEEKA